MAETDAPSPVAAASAAPPILSANGIHLLRTAQQLQMQLSQMADQKASMLMGATFLVFTLAIGQLRSDAATMMLPIAMLATTAFLSAVLAMLAAMPRVTMLSADEIGPKANVLFFGVFTALPEEAFIDRLLDLTASDESVYRTIARDIYQNGQILQRRKYRLLGYAYRTFLTGMVLTAIAVTVEMIWGRFI